MRSCCKKVYKSVKEVARRIDIAGVRHSRQISWLPALTECRREENRAAI